MGNITIIPRLSFLDVLVNARTSTTRPRKDDNNYKKGVLFAFLDLVISVPSQD
jgi:hypothetical protein